MKIGRNDPCPCGSGRKYKNCCLEDQGSGLPNEGTAGVFAEIRQALQGRQFSSLEEVRSFTDRFMHVARLVAELAGLIKKYRGRFILSRECRSLRADHGPCGIYPRLLRSYVRDFSWAYRDRYQDLGFIQSSFLFTLYLLNLHGGEWLPEVYYEDAFLRAFPRVLSEVAPTPYFTPEQTVRSCYSHRTLVNFAAFLGLAEVEPTTKKPYDRLYRVRKRPLLAEAVLFHIPG